MPIIELTVPTGVLGDTAAQELVGDLGRLLLECEQAPLNDRTAAMLWGYVDERPAGRVLVDGAPARLPIYRVTYTVLRGGLSDEGKAALVRETTNRVLDREGCIDPTGRDRGRVWVVVDEVADGNWGAAGQVVRLADAAAFARGSSGEASAA